MTKQTQIPFGKDKATQIPFENDKAKWQIDEQGFLSV